MLNIYDFFMHKFFFMPRSIQHVVSKYFYKPKIHPTVKFFGYCSFSANVEVQKYTYICEHAHLSNVSIGKNCCIAKRFSVVDGQHPYESFSHYDFFNQIGSPLKNYPLKKTNNMAKPNLHTTIGNDVWIGEDVSIKGGVTIGNGAIIGTKSMVTKDVPPYAIVVGNPARIIRYRFNKEKINFLQEVCWWEWDSDEIYKRFDKLSSLDESLLEELMHERVQ